jgi:hypothetical protein
VSRSSGPGHGDSSGDGERDTISQRGPADTRRDGRDGSDDGDDSGGTVPALGESRGGDSDTTSGDSGAGSGGGDGAGTSSGDDGGQSSDGGGSGDGSGDDRLLQQTSPDQ